MIHGKNSNSLLVSFIEVEKKILKYETVIIYNIRNIRDSAHTNSIYVPTKGEYNNYHTLVNYYQHS